MKLINFLLFFLIGIAILLLLQIIFVEIRGEGQKCLSDPLGFGVKKLEDSNSNSIMCSCTLLTPGNPETIYFNSTDLFSNRNSLIK